MAKNQTNTNQLDYENTYQVLVNHSAKNCVRRASSALNNKCLDWMTRDFKAGESVKSLLVNNGKELVVIERGHDFNIPLEKVQMIKPNDFGVKMENTTSKPIKTGIRLSYNEIFFLIFLGILLLGFGIVKIKGVKKIKPTLAY